PSLTITTRNGIAVPLSQIARLNYEYEEPILWRRNRDPVLTVRGGIVDNVQAPDVTNEVLPKLTSIKTALPYGYRIETGGSIEESVKANAALVVVFPVMARDVGTADGAVAEFLSTRLGLRDGAARLDRRNRRPARVQPAIWLC